MFENIGLKKNNYVILDTETSGLSSNDEVIELGVIDTNGKVLYESIFSPTKEISPFIRRLTGIRKADFIGKPTFADEWHKIKSIIKNKTIIGHNVRFDKRMIEQTLEIYDIDSTCVGDVFCGCIDSVALAKKHIKLESYKQEKIATALGIKEENAHRATNDCITLLKILKKLNNVV